MQLYTYYRDGRLAASLHIPKGGGIPCVSRWASPLLVRLILPDPYASSSKFSSNALMPADLTDDDKAIVAELLRETNRARPLPGVAAS